MAIVSLEGVEEIQTMLSRLPEEMYDEVKPVFRSTVLKVHDKMEDRVTDGPLYRRTGALARSFKHRTDGNKLDTLQSRVYTDSSYAPIHETGGVIKAKNAYRGVPGGPYLNIPAKSNLTGSGVMRADAKSVFDQGGYLVKLKNPKKAKYMVALRGKPMFWLVNQVSIKAQLGFVDTAQEEVPTLLSNLSAAIDKAMADA